MESFCPLIEGDVLVLIQKSAKKSYMLDPMPTSLATECLDVLLSEILYVNASSETVIVI